MTVRIVRQWFVIGLLFLMLVSVSVGLMAANTVPPSGASDVTVTLAVIPTMAVATTTP